MTIRVLEIQKESLANGKGLRTVLYLAGCDHQCKGCHNESSWDICGEEKTINELIDIIKAEKYSDVTLSGGDPLGPQLKQTIKLLRAIKEQTNKNVWVYTGYTLEEIQKSEDLKRALSFIDTLVDGKFILEERDLTLSYRGSKNQRIINLKEVG